MFKSRRGGIVLMDDDRRSEKKKRSHKSPHRNDSKPYAGAGGMKKLLAKRKQETEGDKESSAAKTDHDESMTSEVASTGIKAQPEPITSKPPTDWFAAATAGGAAAASGSSLRVGRVKSSRNHIARPAARGKPKFSAAFDEEDDAMDPEEEARRKELEEAAKKIPDFNIPAGFSFAKPEVRSLRFGLHSCD
jgi:nucleoporin NUP1